MMTMDIVSCDECHAGLSPTFVPMDDNGGYAVL